VSVAVPFVARREEALLMRERPVTCPAGGRVTGVGRDRGCFCAIEQQVITAKDDPTSLFAYCEGRYTDCPTWRAEKDRVASGIVRTFAEMRDERESRCDFWMEASGMYARRCRLRDGHDGEHLL
jgi:hypothetical protein